MSRHILNSPTRYGQRAFIQNANLIHGILNLDENIIPRQPNLVQLSGVLFWRGPFPFPWENKLT
jgi:hypothetical protein